MGVSGLFGVLNGRSPSAAELITLRAPLSNSSEAAAAVDSTPARIILFDANGLYHHILYRYCASLPRSLGGEWVAFAAAARQFLAPFVHARCAIGAVWDGCSSRLEAKSATRTQRTQDRRSKMRRFAATMRAAMNRMSDSSSSADANGCAPVDNGAESALPAPSGSLLSFVQVLQSLGVPCWNSDGENDEQLAAMAVAIASTSSQWGGAEGQTTTANTAAPSAVAVECPPVDIVGQDSDFLVLDTRIPGRPADAVGYVTLDSYKFVDEEEQEEENGGARAASASPLRSREAASISFRRYTTESVCAALRLPACLLPSLACLCGNDSALDLLHFHCFTGTPAFRRMLQDSASGQQQQQQALARLSSSNKFSRNNSGGGGGGDQSSSQIVESVLAFLQACSRSAVAASASHARSKTLVAEQERLHLDSMQQLVGRLFGADAVATPRHSPAASPAPHSDSDNDSDEQDAGGDPSRSPDDHAAAAGAASSSVQSFRAAQLKYSLARFFQPQLQQQQLNSSACAWGVFDAGFQVVVDSQSSSSDASVAASNTAVLLPTRLLHLYRSSQLSPILLSVLLTRQFVGHIVVGDAVHPCAVHTLDEEGCCRLAHASSTSSAAASSSKRAQPQHPPPPLSASSAVDCRSAAECVTGVRRRIHGLLFFGMDARPRPLPAHDSRNGSAPSTGLTGLLRSVGRGIVSALLPAAAPTAASVAAASTSSSAAAPSASSTTAAASAATESELVVWELIPTASRADEADSSQWISLILCRADEAICSQAVESAVETSIASQLTPLAFVVPLSSSAFSTAQHRRGESAWLRLCAVLDTLVDVVPTAGSGSATSSTSSSANRISVSQRLLNLRCALTPLAVHHPSLAVLSLVHRQVFLHACRPLLLGRFEPPAVGASVDPSVMAEMRRAVIGLHALTLTAALTITAQSTDDPDSSSSTAARRSSDGVFSVEAVSLSQLFVECYHFTLYAAQAVRLHATLAGGNESKDDDQASPWLPLLPLHSSFQGSLFHRIFARLMREDIEESNASSSSKTNSKHQQNKRKQPATASAAGTTMNATSSSSSSSAALPSVPSSGVFSPALTNALCELDARVAPRARALLLELLVARASPPRLADVQSTHTALQLAVWSSVVGSATAARTYASPIALPASFPTLLKPLACAPFPRPSLSYEAANVQSRTGAADAAAVAASRSQSSSYFSLCCAPDSAYSLLASSAGSSASGPSAAGCACGLRGVHLPDASSTAEDEAAASDDDMDGGARSAWTSAGKGKRKKKGGKGRGKR